MQKILAGNINLWKEPASFSVSLPVVRFLARLCLQLRAGKYRKQEDRGGISYLLQRVKAGNTVFDIGAHKGGYLYYLEKLTGPNGMVIAFEPQSALSQYLKQLKSLLNWHTVRIESNAVSDCSGNATLCIPVNKGKKTSPCATIINSCMPFEIQGKEEVNTVSLDDYCHINRLAPHFLKVDVEGNELAVFKGAREMLIRDHPGILFECEARFIGEAAMAETFSFLLSLGYKGYFIFQTEIRPIEEFSVNHHQSTGASVYCNNFIFE